MRARPFRTAGIVLAVLAMVAPVGHADPINVAPPFHDAYYYNYCDAWVLSTCTSFSEADGETGEFSFEGEITSPLEGAAPGLANADAGIVFDRRGRLNNPVPGIALTVTMHVDEASAELDTLLSDAGAILDGYSNVYGYIDVISFGCFCYDSVNFQLVDADGIYAPTSLEDQDLTFELTLENYDGGPLPRGDLQLYVEVYGYAAIQGSTLPPVPNAGHARFSVDATITSVTAEILA